MINYVKGDAANPSQRPALIIHVCNDIGRWGSGFVLALRHFWPLAETSYRAWSKNTKDQPFRLGETQFVMVDSGVCVCNMIAQHKVKPLEAIPLRLGALDKCLDDVAQWVSKQDPQPSIHLPRIGCGLAGGKWEDVGKLVERHLSQFDTYVYDL